MQYKDISLKLCHDSWTFNSRLSVRRRIFSLSLKIYPRASLPLSKQSVFKSLHLRLTGADGQIINKCCARLSETKKKHSQSIVFWLSLGCFGIVPSITHLSVINYRPRTVNRMRNKWAYNLFWHCIICGEIQTAVFWRCYTGPNYLFSIAAAVWRKTALVCTPRAPSTEILIIIRLRWMSWKRDGLVFFSRIMKMSKLEIIFKRACM